MYRKWAHIYDAIYEPLDYPAQADRIHMLIQKRNPAARSLLDVACGTGLHLSRFRRWYSVQGLDLDPGMLEIARERLGDVPLHEADMAGFSLDSKFDVVTCLFSSIGYARTIENLRKAISTMASHLEARGLLIVEPWITPDKFIKVPGGDHISADFVDKPDLQIARMSRSRVKGRISELDFHFLVNTPAGVEHFTDRSELGLFTDEEYAEAFRDAGLEVEHDPVGLLGRGLFIGMAGTV